MCHHWYFRFGGLNVDLLILTGNENDNAIKVDGKIYNYNTLLWRLNLKNDDLFHFYG